MIHEYALATGSKLTPEEALKEIAPDGVEVMLLGIEDHGPTTVYHIAWESDAQPPLSQPPETT